MQLNGSKSNSLNNLDNDVMEEARDFGMRIPEIEDEPHVLISKVRKTYFDYIVQLLSKNCGVKSDEKRIPSSIWRCARKVEINAAKMCMVVPLYRQNIYKIVNRIKHETTKGRIYGELKTILKVAPSCDKKSQTDINKTDCQSCLRKRTNAEANFNANYDIKNVIKTKDEIVQKQNGDNDYEPQTKKERVSFSEDTQFDEKQHLPENIPEILTGKINGVRNRISSESMSLTCHNADNEQSHEDDQIFKEMEELFKSDDTKEEDIFDQNFNNNQFKLIMDEIREFGGACSAQTPTTPITPIATTITLNTVADKSLDERIAEFPVPLIENVSAPDKSQKCKIERSKWMCELYFRKKQLCEKLDELCDRNYRKLDKVKSHFIRVFGPDSDNEQAPMSPQDNNPEFIYSCKERIAPWIVKNLMPYFLKGRIKSKYVFKGVAKYILKVLIEGDLYPDEYHVRYFINEYFKYHPVIQCESDFY